MSPPEPVASRPDVPDYGIPTDDGRLLPWSWARDHLETAIVYWLATAGPDGQPHAIPIWGAWVDDHWYVEGGPKTRWQRNLRTNAAVSVHVERGSGVVIVEGMARELVTPQPPIADRILAGYDKYRSAASYDASAENWRSGGLWEVRPTLAFGWTIFPDDMTRWRFESD